MNTPALIGPAAIVLRVLRVQAQRHIAQSRALKTLLYGPWGTGKTTVADTLALDLAGTPENIERVNGKEMTIDYTRDLKRRLGHRPLLGDRFVIIANECDAMTPDARDLWLSLLDELPPHFAWIGTSNMEMVNDPKLKNARFQTRLIPHEVGAPAPAEIAAHLTELFPDLPADTALEIGQKCEGCVRSAKLDAENFLDYQMALAA